ncbi:MAG: DUF2569 family protein [Bacteroidetes bacterium]|nr:DUF2569 family protein [Bacteroidota bacterium]
MASPKLGGWLIVLLLHLLGKPVAFVVYHVGSYLKGVRGGEYGLGYLIYYGQMMIELPIVLYATLCAVLLFKMRWNAVLHVQRFMITLFVVYLLVAVARIMVFAELPSIMMFLLNTVGSLGWYFYLRFSKRVETTFPTDPFVVRVTAGRTE